MAEPLSRRERKKQETRQALLHAALSLFREKGYDATTVEEITEQADVAKGTFFNYFSSKEALLGELALWSMEQLRAALDVSQGAPVSPVARIKLLMRLAHEQAQRDIKLIHRAFVVRLCKPLPSPHEGKPPLFGLFANLVGEAQARGEIRSDVNADFASDLLRLSLFRQMQPFHAHDPSPLPEEDMEQVVDLLLEGLAGPTWQPRGDSPPERRAP